MTDLTPGSPEWCRRVSPSKAAAMLGLSPWDSPRSIWHKMHGDVPWDAETEAMERGNLCEPAVLAWWRKHHDHDGWAEQATVTLGDWCVATPDGVTRTDRGPVLIEAKTSSSDWDGDVPIPYLTQVYLAMEVYARAGQPVVGAHVPMLGGRRFLFEDHFVAYDSQIGSQVLDLCRAFYDSLAADEPPDLDDTVATFSAVKRAHPLINRNESVELPADLATEVVEARAAVRVAEARDRLAKSRVVDAMKSARLATFHGATVARRQPDGDGVKFVVVAKPHQLREGKLCTA